MEEKVKILVIGDVMLDIHLNCISSRLSPEAPVPIAVPESETCQIGAAANVAAHITSAGLNCFVAYKASINGHQDIGWSKFIDMATKHNLLLEPLNTKHACPVATKKRVWINNQQSVRLDEEDLNPENTLTEKWISQLINKIRNHNIKIVVFSDYNKGTLNDEIINEIAYFCHKNNIYTILDPKRPTFPELKYIDIIKPNKKEIESTYLNPIECSKKLEKTYLINTLGPKGMVVYRDGLKLCDVPTFAEEVNCVIGCGDTTCALLAIATAKGYNVKDAVIIANRAAAYTIRHRGAYILTKTEIESCLAPV
jgi:D-beta-D-heptose 7-phosphate kinase/D-beta-D-heptose 1-phosphate adenosyltransferase